MTTKRIIIPTVISTSSPSATDDRSKGYYIGFRWLNGASEYVCTDDTVSSAVWTAVGGGGGGGSVNSVTADETTIHADNTDPVNPILNVKSGGIDTTQLASNAVTTAKITDANVTKAKIENISASKLLGRQASGAGVVQEITLGTGLTLTGTTLSAPTAGGVTSVTGDETTIHVDNTDPSNPVVSALGGGGGGTITDWQSEATTITGISSNPSKGTIVNDTINWRRVGDTMEIRIDYEQSSGGSAGSGGYLFALPAGAGSVHIDNSKVRYNTSLGTPRAFGGLGVITDQASYTDTLYMMAYDSTHIGALDKDVGVYGTTHNLGETKHTMSCTMVVPITEWA